MDSNWLQREMSRRGCLQPMGKEVCSCDTVEVGKVIFSAVIFLGGLTHLRGPKRKKGDAESWVELTRGWSRSEGCRPHKG